MGGPFSGAGVAAQAKERSKAEWSVVSAKAQNKPSHCKPGQARHARAALSRCKLDKLPGQSMLVPCSSQVHYSPLQSTSVVASEQEWVVQLVVVVVVVVALRRSQSLKKASLLPPIKTSHSSSPHSFLRPPPSCRQTLPSGRILWVVNCPLQSFILRHLYSGYCSIVICCKQTVVLFA